MKTLRFVTSAMALCLTSSALLAQAPDAEQGQARQQERIGSIFNALFGDRLGSASLEAQWAAGRLPLATQRTQFESRIDGETRSGTLSQATANRLKTDYAELVQLEARYGADRRFTPQERSDLAGRYSALTRALTERGYGDEKPTGDVAKGKAEFERRVDASVSARKISRVEASRLKSDYAALIDVETGYLRDATLSARERDDLDARLDALDSRVGDTGYSGSQAQTPRSRLDAIASALPSSGLSAAARSKLMVEHGDLLRLDAAYSRNSPTADDRSYLDRRLTDLETRARVKR